MVRGIAFLVGAAFTFVLAIALWGSISGLISEPPIPTAEEEFHLHPKEAHLASDGVFGRFDRRQLQRGLSLCRARPARRPKRLEVMIHSNGVVLRSGRGSDEHFKAKCTVRGAEWICKLTKELTPSRSE